MPRIDAHAKGRHDLTDAQWELLAPLLAELPTTGRPRTYGLRGLVDAVRYRTRTGCPWRDIPDRYGPWWRAYALFRSWQVTGVWEHLERELASAVVTAQGPEAVWDEVSVDSTVCRAHVHAAGARRDSPRTVDGEPDDHALGVCRGGWSTKIHAAVDAGCGMLACVLSAGQVADCPMMVPVLEVIRLAACPPHPRHDPGQGRPGRPPQGQGPTRRAPTSLRRRRLQGP